MTVEERRSFVIQTLDKTTVVRPPMDFPEATEWNRNGRSHWLALIVVVLLMVVMAVAMALRSRVVAERATPSAHPAAVLLSDSIG